MTNDSQPIEPMDETVLRMTTETKIFLWVALGAIGIALGFLLPWILQYISTWPLPFMSVFKWLGSFDSPVMVAVRPAVLGVAGLVIAFFITHESAVLRITDERIVVVEGDDSRTITRAQVGGTYLRSGKVRIESPEGRVLFDDDVEGGKRAIAAAFQRHGYPWEGTGANA